MAFGDNILATPAIRKYKQTTGNYIGWMMLERFKSADLFKYNPYIDQIHWSMDAWAVGNQNFQIGLQIVKAQAIQIMKEHNYDKLVIIDHSQRDLHKIHRTAESMGVVINNNEVHTEFHWNEEEIYKEFFPETYPSNYIFFHGKTGLPNKDLDSKVLNNMRIEWGISNYWSNDLMDNTKTPIALAAWAMKHAERRILVDSSLYHIAHALDLKVDIAYFARGKKVWDVVHPLHTDNEIVFFGDKP